MSLAVGKKLGPYEIVSPLGAGGMGEVYRARDTRLDRSVAIKVLPTHLAENAEAKSRFDREAKTISSLNHPNICTLHDVGHQDGVDYLVMELLEGETLAERLKKGALPTEQVLRYGIEICEGLERAHKSGVVHRDLKPGNIMLTKSGAKLMDFGLAKANAVAVAASESSLTMSPSAQGESHPLTAAGSVVGTFQYMAPEQVEGAEADARSDIFALGAVLYEMATGKRAFEGKTAASVIAAVLEREPEAISVVRPMSPAALDRVVKSCLVKDPEERLQTVHDVKLQLKWIGEGSSDSDTASRGRWAGTPTLHANRWGARIGGPWLGWAVAAVAVLSAIAIAVFHFSGQKAAPLVVSQISLPAGLSMNFTGDFAAQPVISPDGSHLVFGAVGQGVSRLYIRALDGLAVTPLSGTENAKYPFWSPDSRSIAFFSEDKLKRMEVSGGVPVTICAAASGRGGSWGKDGVILFTPSLNTGIMKVAAGGGTAVEAVKLDAQRYTTYRWPWWLPDGKHFLYLAANHGASASADTRIFIASVDGKENRPLVQSLSSAIYASGYLLFVRGTALMAQAFDLGSLQLKGEAVVLSEGAQLDLTIWHGSMTASIDGELLYQAGDAASMKLAWVDRSGKDLGSIQSEATDQVALSPDEKRLAYISATDGGMFSYDLGRKISTRLTFAPGLRHGDPVWSADGSRIAYVRQNSSSGATGIYARAASGVGEEMELLSPITGMDIQLCDWSRDGRYLAFVRGPNLWILPLFGDRKAYPYVIAPVSQTDAQFSPNGRWIAYSSAESGTLQVYVAPFPATGAKWQISTGGGDVPRWRNDGKELFFVANNPDSLSVAEVNGSGSGFEVGESHALFRAELVAGNQGMKFSPTKDGQRFVMVTGGDQSSTPLVLVENWTAGLRQR